MNKAVLPSELKLETRSSLLSKLFGNAAPAEMTKKEKLTHWAKLIRKYPHDILVRFDRLECYPYAALNNLPIEGTALEVACNDPKFRAAGLAYGIHAVMQFFGLTQHELHEFSCNCGGAIHKNDVAQIIEGFAR